MGVPGLAPWFFKKYPEYVTYLRNDSMNVDNLYLDANGLVHASAQFVFGYGPKKPMLPKFTNLSYSEKVEMVYELFFRDLMEVIKIMKPKKTLYIALDGPAPVAKQFQQRQRRFVSATAENKPDFDTASITPGTDFSFNLERYFDYRIRLELSTNPALSSVKILFSSQRNPGEGEHKLLDHIRSLSPEVRENEKHVLFSPDGDLIMLCMAIACLNDTNMFLFREDQFNEGGYHFINMKGIVDRINNVDRILDFVFTGTFVGNDFSPKIKMFYHLREGLDFMESIYVGLTIIDKPLIRDGKLNKEGLVSFMKRMKNNEIKFLRDHLYNNRDERFEFKTLTRNVKDGEIDFESFSRDYYEKFGEVEKSDICREYFKVLMWVFEYYTVGLPSWDYFYPYYYPPLMTDLYDWIEENDLDIKFEKGEASKPFVALMSVIPYENRYLLPKNLQGEVRETEPFTIDFEGVQKEYQGVVKVPFIDREDVERSIKKYEIKSIKNNFESNYCYFIGDTRTKYVSNKYGTLISNVKREPLM